ncbi:hypothetical protein EVAR_54355_1 [Eumeta japonica]|uniref:Uncharacterized protein n=1 Tax=Eumeta variegata TaxID=151549 RepID=A0A4C1Z640_EUMVA|nr:hypothetical protein EVAR_54355_1 [Eumeta japonica]
MQQALARLNEVIKQGGWPKGRRHLGRLVKERENEFMPPMCVARILMHPDVSRAFDCSNSDFEMIKPHGDGIRKASNLSL